MKLKIFCYLSNNSSGALEHVKGRVYVFLGIYSWLEVELLSSFDLMIMRK